MFHQLHSSSLCSSPRDRVTSFLSGGVGNVVGDGCSMSKTGRGMRLSIDMARKSDRRKGAIKVLATRQRSRLLHPIHSPSPPFAEHHRRSAPNFHGFAIAALLDL